MDKSELGVTELDFLGHHVSSAGIQPMGARVEAILEYSPPTDKAWLQRFLGIINYYQCFLQWIAAMLIPLHAEVEVQGKAKNELTWSEVCQKAFVSTKTSFAETVLLQHPDEKTALRLTVDASEVAMGAQLQQKRKDHWAPIAFFSKKLSTEEVKYSAFDRELLGIYAAIRHFRSFLEGRTFTVLMDHKPLCTALASLTECSPRQTRHISVIAEFMSDIQHVKGVDNHTADALSRVSSATTDDTVSLTVSAMANVPKVDYVALAQAQIASTNYRHTRESRLVSC